MIPKLKLCNISKSFGTLDVLDTIQLTVNSGDIVSLVGPSGSGKSTLCDIIAGIEGQTSGTILLDGKQDDKRAGKFGYMLQNPLLLPWRTVIQNIILGTDIRGVSKKKSMQQASTLLRQFGLIDFAGMYPYALSGGMKQRIALLRTVLFHDDVLLLDEPFGALDALTRLSCQLWLLTLWETYASTILLITHDIREAILLSDRIYVMSERPGKIIGEFVVDLPRPRKKEDVTSKKAVFLEKELLKMLLQ